MVKVVYDSEGDYLYIEQDNDKIVIDFDDLNTFINTIKEIEKLRLKYNK